MSSQNDGSVSSLQSSAMVPTYACSSGVMVTSTGSVGTLDCSRGGDMELENGLPPPPVAAAPNGSDAELSVPSVQSGSAVSSALLTHTCSSSSGPPQYWHLPSMLTLISRKKGAVLSSASSV